MNIEEYILSGIIEQYVLGLTTPEENMELEKMAMAHPEVREAIESSREAMDSYTDLHQVNPPNEMKERILNAIREEKKKVSDQAPLHSIRTDQAKVYNLSKYKWMVAASIVLLIISLSLNGIYIYKYNQTKERYTTLLASQKRLVAKNNSMQTRMENVEQDMRLLTNPDVQPIVMKGVSAHPGMEATVYFDGQNRKAYLGQTNLPKPPAGKEYQLWAIIDGKPVDMGLYSGEKQPNLVPMKNAAAGTIQAFAITLENEGGSPAPTMDQMYVMGKI